MSKYKGRYHLELRNISWFFLRKHKGELEMVQFSLWSLLEKLWFWKKKKKETELDILLPTLETLSLPLIRNSPATQVQAQGGASGKESPVNVGDTKDIFVFTLCLKSPGRGNGNSPRSLARKSHGQREPWGLMTMRPQRAGHNWALTEAMYVFTGQVFQLFYVPENL